MPQVRLGVWITGPSTQVEGHVLGNSVLMVGLGATEDGPAPIMFKGQGMLVVVWEENHAVQ